MVRRITSGGNLPQDTQAELNEWIDSHNPPMTEAELEADYQDRQRAAIECDAAEADAERDAQAQRNDDLHAAFIEIAESLLVGRGSVLIA